ncbi:unnamed protein product [Effrenium voratum]|nr:unnamed protein product [Effrenium voratum]
MRRGILPLGSVLLLPVDAAGVLGSGPAAGALVIGSEDLGKVRGALGRIADEIHLVLGILDQHLEASVPAPMLHPHEVPGLSEDLQLRARQVEAARRAAAEVAGRAAGVAGTAAALAAGDFVPMPRATEAPTEGTAVKPQPEPKEEMQGSPVFAWLWTGATSLFWVGVFFLDIAIVIGMQIFLESIGRKRGTGREIMSSKAMANALKAGAKAIPEPSATSTQRLSVLSQEELLAAVLTEHWVKIVIGLGLAVAFRLPQCFLNQDGVVFHMLFTLAMVLRFMSPVMLWFRDDMTLPKKEKATLAAEGAFPVGNPGNASAGNAGTVGTTRACDSKIAHNAKEALQAEQIRMEQLRSCVLLQEARCADLERRLQADALETDELSALLASCKQEAISYPWAQERQQLERRLEELMEELVDSVENSDSPKVSEPPSLVESGDSHSRMAVAQQVATLRVAIHRQEWEARKELQLLAAEAEAESLNFGPASSEVSRQDLQLLALREQYDQQQEELVRQHAADLAAISLEAGDAEEGYLRLRQTLVTECEKEERRHAELAAEEASCCRRVQEGEARHEALALDSLDGMPRRRK